LVIVLLFRCLCVSRRMEEEDLFCLQYDMNDCYSRLKRLVPTIPQDKKVSKVEILQHVIDYILDLQLALETHPSLQKQQPQRTCPPAASNPNRTPLTVLNIDHHQVSFRPWGDPFTSVCPTAVRLRQSASTSLPFTSIHPLHRCAVSTEPLQKSAKLRQELTPNWRHSHKKDCKKPQE
ncbi:hypothetical protein GOODEAATRI_016389, partial [Goodea atripinnis]